MLGVLPRLTNKKTQEERQKEGREKDREETRTGIEEADREKTKGRQRRLSAEILSAESQELHRPTEKKRAGNSTRAETRARYVKVFSFPKLTIPHAATNQTARIPPSHRTRQRQGEDSTSAEISHQHRDSNHRAPRTSNNS